MVPLAFGFSHTQPTLRMSGHTYMYIYIAGRLTDYKYTYGRSDEQRTNVSEPLHLLALLYPMLIPGRENTQA